MFAIEFCIKSSIKKGGEEGAHTYNASCGMHFQMRAALFWTIDSYPGFSNVSGWRTKGYHACYTCNDEPYSETL